MFFPFFLLLLVPFILETNAQEDIVVLETGYIYTSLNEYEISDKFEIRVIGDGDFIRMKGITVSGYPYYVYQKMTDDERIVYGKIFVGSDSIQVIPKTFAMTQIKKESTWTQDETSSLSESKKNLIVQVESTQSSRYNEQYRLSVKVYDGDINPHPALFSKTDGLLKSIPIKAVMKDKNGNVLTNFEGITDNSGKFVANYYWKFSDVKGEFNIMLDVNDGNHVQNLKTYYLGYVPTDNDPPP